jgi:hypothetical protein
MQHKIKSLWFLGLLTGSLAFCFSSFAMTADQPSTSYSIPVPTVAPLNPEEMVFKEFRHVSGLNVKYPDKAMILDAQSLESQIPKELLVKRQLKILFLASDTKKFYQLIVEEEEFDSNLSVSQVNGELIKDAKLRGTEERATILKMDNQSLLLEGDKIVNGALFKNKRKIICKKTPKLTKMKVYIVEFLTTPNQYSYYSLVLNKIIEEAGITENQEK